MNLQRTPLVVAIITFFALAWPPPRVWSSPEEQVDAKAHCPVCGMFVAKYPQWLAQIRHTDQTVLVFDGVKDLLAYLFLPQSFGRYTAKDIQEIWVKDYYGLNWVDGRSAFFVEGGDIYGPMGHELIPFASRPAAENFLADHRGRQVLTFGEITPELVATLRSGQKMR